MYVGIEDVLPARLVIRKVKLLAIIASQVLEEINNHSLAANNYFIIHTRISSLPSVRFLSDSKNHKYA